MNTKGLPSRMEPGSACIRLDDIRPVRDMASLLFEA